MRYRIATAIIGALLASMILFQGTLHASGQTTEAVDLPAENVTATAVDDPSLDTELSPGAVSVVRPQEFSGEMKDLPQLLERIPGLHIVRARGRGAYTVASIRGSTSSQVSVYVDGMLMNLGSEAAVDLSAIPVENVEKVEVYRGYIPARFGSTSMGGVINIVTKKPDGKSSSTALGTGSYGLFRASASHSGTMGSGRYFIGANHESSDGDFKYDNDNRTPHNSADDYRAKRRDNDYSNTDLLFKWTDDEWHARVAWLKHDRSLPLSAAGADKPDSPSGADLDTEKLEISLGKRYEGGESAGIDWGWRLDYQHQDKKFDDPNDTLGGINERHNRYKTDRYGIAADLSTAVGENHFLELYAGYHDETLKPRGDIVTALGGSSKMSEQTYEISVQDSISIAKDGSLLLIPSVRWNADSNDDELTWQIALNKVWPTGWHLKSAYGTYARGPNLYERYGDGAMLRPNKDLKWESGTQWDFTLGWQGEIQKGWLSAGATYFVRDTDDLIEYVMSSARHGIYENVGEARVEGVELEVLADWENGWGVQLSGTWMNAEDRTPGSYRSGNPLPNRPEWEALLRLSRKWNEKVSSFAEVQFTGENYYDTAGNVKMDDLTLVNAGVSYNFENGMKLTFGIDDIFDEGPDVSLASAGAGQSRMMWYPLQGRTIYTTLIWNF